MLTEADCAQLGIELAPPWWTVQTSPLVHVFDRSIGGTTTFFLGNTGSGKSLASLLWAWRACMFHENSRTTFRRERLWYKGIAKNTNWLWRFGGRSVVWVPKGTDFRLFQRRNFGGRELPVTVRQYNSYKELLRSAKFGVANVLYWSIEEDQRWVEFQGELLERPDGLPQLLYDEEVQNVAPQGARRTGYDRALDEREWMRRAREHGCSCLFSTQFDSQTDYNVIQLAHNYVVMKGARVPDHVQLPPRANGRPTTLYTTGLPSGTGYVIADTYAKGVRYQQVVFDSLLSPEYETRVEITDSGVHAPVPPLRMKHLTEAEKRRIEQRYTALNGRMTVDDIRALASEMGRSERTIVRLLNRSHSSS